LPMCRNDAQLVHAVAEEFRKLGVEARSKSDKRRKAQEA
jgi:hypothetical protein